MDRQIAAGSMCAELAGAVLPISAYGNGQMRFMSLLARDGGQDNRVCGRIVFLNMYFVTN
jgi:hypothetical protein